MKVPPLQELMVCLSDSFVESLPLIGGSSSQQATPAASTSSPGTTTTTTTNTTDQSTQQQLQQLQQSQQSQQPLSATQKAALDQAAQRLYYLADKYLAQQETGQRHLEHLKSSQATLRALEESLLEKKGVLLVAGPDMHTVSERVKEWSHDRAFGNVADCVEPQDVLHGQAINLLAEIHACDDAMDLLECSLKRGTVQLDEYLKQVADVARRQFVARYTLKKVCARISADMNVRLLCKKYATFDKSFVEEILRSSGYSHADADRRLCEMALPE